MQRVDLNFSTAEAVILRLPADTRRVRILSPDNASSMLIKFDSALPDGSDDPSGRLVTEWLGAAAVTSTPGGVWGAIPPPRAYLIEGVVELAFVWGDDLTIVNSDLRAGDYLLLRQRDGVAWDPMNPVLQRTQYGRLMVREGVAYESREDYLEQQIQRLRDAIDGTGGLAPASPALLEIEAPDGRTEKYVNIATMLRQLHILENRLAFLRAANGASITGFQLAPL